MKKIGNVSKYIKIVFKSGLKAFSSYLKIHFKIYFKGFEKLHGVAFWNKCFIHNFIFVKMQ